MNEAMQLILSELQRDPSHYSAMTDKEVADAVNQLKRLEWDTVPAEAVLSALTAAGVAGIADAAATTTTPGHATAAAVDYFLSMMGYLHVEPGTITRQWLDDLASPPANVIPAAAVLALEALGRKEVAILSAPANHGDVAWVRREVLKVTNG